ncbi:MAG: hypothetical protein JJD96_03450 [Thermoleophilia bacterium]|nr:hypothetical protein [Thermoleophilia bacterium]
MKKRLLTLQFFAVLVFLIIIAVAPASSWGLATGDGTWQWVNPSVQGNTLRSLSFVNANTGWAAGDGGTILKTTDGGANWSTQIPATNSCAGATPYGSGCNLKGISFIDANNGWAVGAFGTIWHTINGGSSWAAQSLPGGTDCGGGSCVYANLYGVHFINSSVGIAVGPSYAFATRDGGGTWVKIGGVNTGHNLNAVQLVDSSNGFAVGDNGVVYKITWSGSAWAAAQQTGTGTQSLTGLYFANASNGFAVGGGRLWRTVNGGTTWLKNETPRPENFRAVTMTGNTLVVTGGTEVFGEYTGSSVILKRTAATNWTDPINTVASGLSAATSTGTTDQLLAVAFPGGSSTGFAAGEAGGIVKTTDTGDNWSLTAGGNGKRFTDSSFINGTTGWMVAIDGSVVKTTNAGSSWTSDASGIAAGTKLRGVSFLDISTGFAVGYSGLLGNGTNAGVAYKYVSGTWSAMTVPAGVATLEAIHMTSATSGWAVGRAPGDTGVGAGVALKTTDGSNWVFDSSGIDGNIRLYGVDATSASNGWAVGENLTSGKAVVLKYTAGAPGSWAVTEKTDSQGFLSIDMVNGNTGYAVGYVSPSSTNPAYNQEGRIYKTIDGGANWNNISPSGTSTQYRFLVDVSFLDANTGYVVASEGGRILKTSDGGTTWTPESAGVGSNMNTVSVVPSTWSALGYAVFAAGDNASILRSPTFDEASFNTRFNAKWNALSGAPGDATGAVTPTNGGIYKDYVNGRLYLNQSTDTVYWVHGAILTKYDQLGRETGALGLPISDEMDVSGVTGARESDFTHGRIYWGPGVGSYGVSDGAIMDKYVAGGGPAVYGIPTGDESSVSGGRAQNMQKATLTWDGSTANPAYAVVGGILAKYKAKGGPTGTLGLATGDEKGVSGVSGARESDFTGGRIYWGPGVGAFAMTDQEIIDIYDAPPPGVGTGPEYFGLPTSDVYTAYDGHAQNMQKAIFTTNPYLHAHYVRGGVMVKYQMMGGPTGLLHLIELEEAPLPGVPDASTAVNAVLQNGRIYWSLYTGSHIVNGGVYVTYMNFCTATGCGPKSRLGLPITDEYPIALPGGAARSQFQHGFITWWILYGSWVDVYY